MNIIVTGASRGIGYELSRILSDQEGNTVIAIARNATGLTGLKNQCGNNLQVLPFDLVHGNYQQEFLPALTGTFKTVDVVVNNAGLLVHKPFKSLSEDDFDLMFGANVKGAFRLIQALMPYFSVNSHILNIGSMGGFQGSVKFPGLSLYSASKGALAILTECMAEEFKELDIKVNCLALGSAQTEMLAMAFPGYKAPLSAREMASFVADFALNGHRFFNGKILPVSVTTP